jgi:hypothetical protein
LQRGEDLLIGEVAGGAEEDQCIGRWLGLVHGASSLHKASSWQARGPGPSSDIRTQVAPFHSQVRRTRSPCCARAASGHAAALPSSVMNSRLFSRSNCMRSPPAWVGLEDTDFEMVSQRARRQLPPDCGHAVANAYSRHASSGLMQCGKEHPYWMALEASTILGRRMVNVEPLPGSLATVMSPPII